MPSDGLDEVCVWEKMGAKSSLGKIANCIALWLQSHREL